MARKPTPLEAMQKFARLPDEERRAFLHCLDRLACAPPGADADAVFREAARETGNARVIAAAERAAAAGIRH